ncbi:hypothetical protein [Arsukibacterium perlucidum]|nr:hypothetical protein [Arsukibacterium perlucidum]
MQGSRHTDVTAAGMLRRLKGHMDVILEAGEVSVSASLYAESANMPG